MKLSPIFLLSALVIALALPARAQSADPTYAQLLQSADLVVIATPTDVKDLEQKTILPGVARLTADNQPAPVVAIQVETTFAIDTVLKGKLTGTSLVLYHLRDAEPVAPVPGAPQLVSFDPIKNLHYLLFLKKEKDGRYTSVTGQVDPALGLRQLAPAISPAPAPAVWH